MELLTQQPLGKASSTGESEHKAGRDGITSVAETGLDTAAVGLEEEEEGKEKGEFGAEVPAAVFGEQDRREESSVAPGVPKRAAGAAAAAGDLSQKRGTGEQQQAPGSMQGEAKAPVAEVGGEEGGSSTPASNSSATSRPGGGTSAGARSSCEDVGSGGGGEEEEEGGGKSEPEGAVVEAMSAVAEAITPAEAMLQPAEAALARLLDTHDNFFSSDKDEKQRRLEAESEEVMETLARVGDIRDIRQRARVSYIRGRALDVFSDFNPEAEKCLAKAVKLNPAEPDGWDALGHCYWKKPDLLAARRCFHQALDKGRKPESLRQLSMLLRQLPGTAEEASDHLQESLRLAKEAVAMDVGSGTSWYVLGNAFVASFFRNSRGVRDLDRALQAYKKAEFNGGGGNPDLFFNRAHVFHYREDYPEAVRDYRLARELDPSLPVDQALHSIETGVERLAKLVEKKGGLKAKRLSQLIASLAGSSARKGLEESHRLVRLRDLMLGENKGVAVALKVTIPAGHNSQPPERFVVVDGNGEFAVLSLYSISKEACERIRSKDTLIVKNPALRTICLGLQPVARVASSSVAGTAKHAADAGKVVSSVGRSDNPITAVGDKSTISANDTAGLGNTGSIACASDTEVLAASCRETLLGAAPSLSPSYPGIQTDPTDILLNGEAMKASFAAPNVRLANFDK